MTTAEKVQEPRIALALSGGGFRASLFHLGVLRRLAELGWLNEIDVISCVSGGSLVGAFMTTRWSEMLRKGGDWPAFEEVIVAPFIRVVSTHNFTQEWALRLLLVPLRKLADRTFTRTKLAAEMYSRLFYDHKTCADLPRTPYLVINATNLQSIRAWRFTRSGMGDSRLGHAAWGDHPMTLGECTGASAAFPPVFTPTRIAREGYQFGPPLYGESPLPPYSIIPVSDGGVYDNLAVEALIKDTPLPAEMQPLRTSRFLIVSDAGYPPQFRFRPSGIPLLSEGLLLYRVDDIAREQVCALRRRSIVQQFLNCSATLKGLLVVLGSNVNQIPCDGAAAYAQAVGGQCLIPIDLVARVQAVRTDLDRFSAVECEALMYHAYTMTDAFLWAHRDTAPESYRVPDTPNPAWRIDFTAEECRRWEDGLATSHKRSLFR